MGPCTGGCLLGSTTQREGSLHSPRGSLHGNLAFSHQRGCGGVHLCGKCCAPSWVASEVAAAARTVESLPLCSTTKRACTALWKGSVSLGVLSSVALLGLRRVAATSALLGARSCVSVGGASDTAAASRRTLRCNEGTRLRCPGLLGGVGLSRPVSGRSSLPATTRGGGGEFDGFTARGGPGRRSLWPALVESIGDKVGDLEQRVRARDLGEAVGETITFAPLEAPVPELRRRRLRERRGSPEPSLGPDFAPVAAVGGLAGVLVTGGDVVLCCPVIWHLWSTSQTYMLSAGTQSRYWIDRFFRRRPHRLMIVRGPRRPLGGLAWLSPLHGGVTADMASSCLAVKLNERVQPPKLPLDGGGPCC